jgi:hypothetical protein
MVDAQPKRKRNLHVLPSLNMSGIEMKKESCGSCHKA